MKNTILFLVFLLISGAFIISCSENNQKNSADIQTDKQDSASLETVSEAEATNDIPWTPEELMQPKQLAESINNNSADKPVIFNMGPSGSIKGAIDIGPAEEAENMEKLKAELSKLPKDKPVVVYCGCCPYERCPNVRPAFKLLKEMNFVNGKLLDMPENLKTDWINKGYPMKEE
ncbi:MAG: rhodanese-like domain-containing protein [Bacteroidia bacterium]